MFHEGQAPSSIPGLPWSSGEHMLSGCCTVGRGQVVCASARERLNEAQTEGSVAMSAGRGRSKAIREVEWVSLAPSRVLAPQPSKPRQS